MYSSRYLLSLFALITSLSLLGCGASMSKLTKAVNGGDIIAVETALKDGAKIDEYDGFGGTALYDAVHGNNIEMVKLLLSKGANPSLCTRGNKCPVIRAAELGNILILQSLVDEGADINQEQYDGNRPIHMAVLSEENTGNRTSITASSGTNTPASKVKHMIAMLKQYGAASAQFKKAREELSAISKQQGNAPAQSVTRPVEVEIDVLTYLLELRADINVANGKGEYPIVIASKHGKVDVVKALLEAGADVNQQNGDGDRPLHEAARAGHQGLVTFLLAQGAEVELDGHNGFPPLAMAASNGHVEIIKILLGAGANPNKPSIKNGGYPIVQAASQNNPEAAMLLLAAGANINQVDPDKERPLYKAAQSDNAKMVNFLIAAGAEIDFYSYNGWTPLTVAAHNGNSEVVKALLAAGADPDYRDNDNITALYYATKTKKITTDVINYLAAAGADMNATQDKYRWTALHVAASKNYTETAEQLLKLGADPDVRDVDGDTALHLAANEGQYGMAEALLSYGASVNMRNKKGKTASDLASGYKKTSAVLASYGGRPKQKSGSSFGKIFATAAIAGLAGSADLSADQTAQVMSATVNDIWVKDGQGTQLGEMYRNSLERNGTSNNPIVREMVATRSEQQSASQIMNAEMAKYRAIIEEQKKKQQMNKKPTLYEQAMQRINAQNSGVSVGVNRPQPTPATGSLNIGQNSPAMSIPVAANNEQARETTIASNAVANSPTQTQRDTESDCSGLVKISATHILPVITVEAKDHLSSDGAIPQLSRQAKEHMEAQCGAHNVAFNLWERLPHDREVLKARKANTLGFDYVRLTSRSGQKFSCGCNFTGEPVRGGPAGSSVAR